MANAVIGALRVNLALDTAAWEDGIKKVQSQMAAVGKKMQSVGQTMSVGLTAPLAAFGALSIKTAGDFEASLNRVRAASGATAGEMEKLRTLAMDLGSSTSKSAAEAADAIEMLAKNGLTTTQILGGAAEASLMLSEATGGELSQAADVATNVMAQFKIEAQDMGKVVDGITGVTLSSQFGFEDYALALGQAGGVAAAVGVELEDFNTAVAATSSVFTSGSDAGTSFKNFLLGLKGNSSDARAAIENLNLQFYDANGSMKSMGEIAEELRVKMGSLSELDLSRNMHAIFGVDGMRTGIALMDQGAAGIENFRRVVGEASAEEQAAARMAGFNGEMEKLRGAFETLQIAIASSGLLEFMTGLVSRLAEIVSKLSESNPALLKWGTVVAGLAAIIGPVLISLGLMATAFAAISAPVLATVAAIAAVTAGVTALYQVWQNWNQIAPVVQQALTAAEAAIADFAARAFEVLKAMPSQMLQIGRDIMAGLAQGIRESAANALQSARDAANGVISSITGIFDIHSPSRVMHGVGQNVVQGLGDGMQSLEGGVTSIADNIASSVSGAFKGIIDGTKSVKDAIKEVLTSLASMLMDRAFQSLFSGGGLGGGGGLFGGLLSGLGGLLGFKNGGSFNVGGAGGIDSQLVAFRASPNEAVSITKPGQDMGGAGGRFAVEVVPSPYFDVRVQKISDQVSTQRVAQSQQQARTQFPAFEADRSRRMG